MYLILDLKHMNLHYGCFCDKNKPHHQSEISVSLNSSFESWELEYTQYQYPGGDCSTHR